MAIKNHYSGFFNFTENHLWDCLFTYLFGFIWQSFVAIHSHSVVNSSQLNPPMTNDLFNDT